MKLNRFFYDGLLNLGSEIILDGDEFRHAFLVLRTRETEKLCLFNGDGVDYVASVLKIGKKDATLRIDSATQNNTEAHTFLRVYQALAKGDKLGLVAQKLTEIGASEMTCFHSEFCDVKQTTAKLDRLDRVVVSACKQCGRARTMKTSDTPLKFSELAASFGDLDAVFLAYENETENDFAESLYALKNAFKNANKTGLKIGLIIGPEGGFSDGEVGALKKAGARVVTLGKRILRTETCAIVAAGLIIQILG